MCRPPLDTSVNEIYSKHKDPAPIFSNLIGQKFTDKSSSNVDLRCQINLTCDAVLTKSPNLVNLGLSNVHTSEKIGSVFIPTTRIGTPTDGSNCLLTGYHIGGVAADRVSKMGSEQDYNAKTDFETRRENQDSGRQNISMS